MYWDSWSSLVGGRQHRVQDGLLNVKTVSSLLDDHAAWPVENFIRDFHVAAHWQAVHELRALRGALEPGLADAPISQGPADLRLFGRTAVGRGRRPRLRVEDVRAPHRGGA